VYKAVKVLSFKHTALFKRGIWLSAAALVACVAIPVILDPELRVHPFPNLFGVCALGVFLGYLIWSARIFRLVDEVVDCEDHLKLKRGRNDEILRFSNIATAEASMSAGMRRITLRLRESTKFGSQIEFLPQASLWSNPSGVQRVAISLAERAHQAAALHHIKD
jgi:hypothetical protein